MKKGLFLLFISISQLTFAQSGWNWPEDEENQSLAKERQAFSKVSIQLENYDDAWNSLIWLYTNTPDLHRSIYMDGSNVLEALLKTDITEERQSALEDSLLWMYDQRIKYFEDEGTIMNRKAYTAFKQFYKRPEKYSLLTELYEKAFELNGSNISTFNLTPYMTLAKYYHQRDPEAMPAEKVLDIHAVISEAIDGMRADGKVSPDKLKKEQDKVDALFSSIDGILSCDFIANSLVPKLDANPNDLNTAKKIFNYSLQAKCSDEPFFTRAGDIVFENQPNFKLSSALGSKYLAAGETDRAIGYFQKCLELSNTDEERYDAYISMSSSYSKQGKKSSSREMAYKALEIKPGDSRAYNILGNLYFTSFDDCKEGKSKVMDRAVFIAAYEMYAKAGNTEQMEATQAQFPSSEEIFNEDYEVGEEVPVGCWISKSVKLRRRD